MKAIIGLTWTALALSACASAPQPVVRHSATLPAGLRTVALAPAPPGAMAPGSADRAAIEQALTRAGFTFVPTTGEARYLLVLAQAAAPRRMGSLLPPAEGAPKTAIQWIARPPRGLGAGFGPKTGVRLDAILVERATGREMWRGTLAGPQRKQAGQSPAMTARVLAELPRAQAPAGS